MPAAVEPSRRRAFTLLEITISIFLILLLLSIAVPSLSGQLSRQKLQRTFDRFDTLAAAAQKRSVAEGRAYVLIWTREGLIRLYPAGQSTAERKKQGPAATLDPAASPTGGGHYLLLRGSSLTTDPASVWTFWPTGNCEPVGVRYEGPAGQWEAVYSPLSGKGTVKSFVAR